RRRRALRVVHPGVGNPTDGVGRVAARLRWGHSSPDARGEVRMSAAPTFRFPLRIEAVAGNLGGPDAVEDFALDLRRELADLDVTRTDPGPGGPAPEGTPALPRVAPVAFVVPPVQRRAALAQVPPAPRP